MKNIVIIFFFLIGLIACEQAKQKQSEATIKSTNQVQKSKPDTIKKEEIIKDTTTHIDPNEILKEQQEKAAASAYNRGVRYYQKGDMENAFVQFKSALEKSPENSNINHYLGRLYYDMGQKELALSYYEDAVRFNPGDSVSILGVGQVHFDRGDYKNAMKYYDMSLETAPNYGLAYYNRGTLLGMQNKYIEALDDLNKSIDLDPENGNAFLNRGLAYYYLKQMNSACRDWEKAAAMGIKKAETAIEEYCRGN